MNPPPFALVVVASLLLGTMSKDNGILTSITTIHDAPGPKRLPNATLLASLLYALVVVVNQSLGTKNSDDGILISKAIIASANLHPAALTEAHHRFAPVAAANPSNGGMAPGRCTPAVAVREKARITPKNPRKSCVPKL
jgi:hypothetical protein